MNIKLNDKYTLSKGVRFLTGSQALVRLALNASFVAVLKITAK